MHTVEYIGVCVSRTEGLAVGVGFGAAGKTSSATFESARQVPMHLPLLLLI